MKGSILLALIVTWIGAAYASSCFTCGPSPSATPPPEIANQWDLSGTVTTEYGLLSGMAFQPDTETLWVLFETVATSPFRNGTGTLLGYDLTSVLTGKRSYPIDGEAPTTGFALGLTPSTMNIPTKITGSLYTLQGLTFNAASNFVILGTRPDSEDFEGILVGTDGIEPVVFMLNNVGEEITGPAVADPPVTNGATSVGYDISDDSYWITDMTSAALYQTLITCCREKHFLPPTWPQDRWQQRLNVRRGVGLQYGLRGTANIFQRRSSSSAVYLGNVAAPALASPQAVVYDPYTGHLFLVNNFPSTTLIELTRDMQVVSHYNLEEATGGLRDAAAVAVDDSYIYVGFRNESYIAVFEKPDSVSSSEKRQLVRAKVLTPEKIEEKKKMNIILKEEKALEEKIEENKRKENARKGQKSHFH